jgi:DNA polymerase III sliding clamp (beta) subunit (PCNA family)
MEITCKTEKLRNMVGLIDRLTAKHPSLPILSYILCTTWKDSISFRATNLSIGAEGVVDGSGGEESFIFKVKCSF